MNAGQHVDNENYSHKAQNNFSCPKKLENVGM